MAPKRPSDIAQWRTARWVVGVFRAVSLINARSTTDLRTFDSLDAIFNRQTRITANAKHKLQTPANVPVPLYRTGRV